MLTETQIEKNYNTFKKYIKGYISRPGVEEFITWLDTTDCRKAPASTKYHCSYEGGLVVHCLNVFKRVFGYMKNTYGDLDSNCPYTKDTLALVSLLHDINKVNFYRSYQKNVQNPETGKWEPVMAYNTRDNVMLGSAEENAIQILNKFFSLTDEETYAIRYHMGYTENGDSFYRNNMLKCYASSELAIVLHQQDEWAITRDETEAIQFTSIKNNSEEVENKEESVSNTGISSHSDPLNLSNIESRSDAPERIEAPF